MTTATAPSEHATADDGAGAISFRDVRKAFLSRGGTESEVLSHLNLSIADGEFFCLVGPSGCGKTTVLGMVAGFEKPSGGTLTVGGAPVGEPDAARGVVFQGDDSLFTWLTAQQNVEFGLKMKGMPAATRRQRARAMLALVGLKGQEHKFPTELSGGMKQRVQIARVFVNNPRILLMDEPFGALDAQTRLLLQESLRDIWRRTRTTALFITHDVEEAIMLGTRVGVMRAGPRANLKAIVDIDLPGVRDRTSPHFTEYYRQLHGLLRDEIHAPSATGGVS